MAARRSAVVAASRIFSSLESVVTPAAVFSQNGQSFGAAVPMPQHPVRRLHVHEYQGAQLMAKFGVNVPKGMVASTPAEAVSAAKQLATPDGEIVIKSQVLAGGRGLGTFKNGFKGGVHVTSVDNIESIASKMLGQILVTKQTGEEGKPVNKVLLAEKLKVANEMYFAILLDRATAGPVIIACQKGGTSIEDLAEKYPEMIIKVPIDVFAGISDSQACAVVDGLELKFSGKDEAVEQVKRLYKMFANTDCTMLEINPLAETSDGHLVAADAKINFDDNAAYRQKEIFVLRDESQEDPREVTASKADLNYIGLTGEIGCMVNGAGLAMATMDIIQLHGSSPANFLDVGGNASEEQVIQAFKILTSDSKVKAILVNIFGGIMRCDVIASGIVNAAKQVSLHVPLIVRLEGTNVDIGKRILQESGLPIITADDLDDGAKKAVEAAKAGKA